MMNEMKSKSELRRLIRQRKSQCSCEELDDFSQKICQQVIHHDLWLHAHTVLLYNSLPDEVDTRWLIEDALKSGKTVLLPVVRGDDLELRLYSDQMQTGSFGIQEPLGKAFLDYSSIDLAIVPGMAFDAVGNRLGRGRGYYDRLLPRIPHLKSIGICFPFQLLDLLPTDSHDISMTEIITC